MALFKRGSVFLEDQEAPKVKTDTCTCLKDNLLLILTVCGIVLGFIIGFAIRPLKPSEDALMWIGMPGEVFLRLLKMMILPLVVSCIISGSASLDPRCNGKISMLSLTYIVLSNAVCALVGVLLTVAIHPGQPGVDFVRNDQISHKTKTQDIFADLIRNFIPDNLVSACIRQVHTSYTQHDVIALVNATTGDMNATYLDKNATYNNNATGIDTNATNVPDFVNTTIQKDVRHIGYTEGANLLGIVFASMVFGIATCLTGETARPFYEFFSATSDIIVKIFSWFLWYSPIGIASLTATAIAAIEDPAQAFIKLGYFVLTISAGVVFHQVILLPAVSFIVWRKNPFLLYVYQIKGWLTAFATTSGVVCIPYFTRGCERYGVDKRITRFVIPFSLTMSRNGSAIYVAASAIFLAQLGAIPLDAGTVIVIWLLTSLLVMALPDIPSGSIVILMIVLQSTGLPVKDIASLFTVEWFLDRIRSTSNAISHCFATVFVYALCKGDIEKMSRRAGSREECQQSCDLRHQYDELHHQSVELRHQNEELRHPPEEQKTMLDERPAEVALNGFIDPLESLQSDDEETVQI